MYFKIKQYLSLSGNLTKDVPGLHPENYQIFLGEREF